MSRVGLMGCGWAAELYLRQACTNCQLQYVACADVDSARAAAVARQYGILDVCTPHELLAHPDVEVVVNVTPPALHGAIGFQVLEAGKHLFNEKPIAASVEEGRRLLQAAAERRLRVGCAPDTFLGPALQSARALVDAGRIGTPFAAVASVLMVRPETWHPRPAHYYVAGGGPLFDIGPYYLTALVWLLGPVAQVAGDGAVAEIDRRTLDGGGPIAPRVATHEVGILRFASGAIATIGASFDAAGPEEPVFELYGSGGSLRLPNPNYGEGALAICPSGRTSWSEEPAAAAGGQSRCAGIEDMMAAAREGRPHRASGELALHVLDVMESLQRSAAERGFVRLRTTCERPAPLSTGSTRPA